ncbi:MAG: hypothetical protein HQM14_07215 [SAR324 cluster bacterium]|nr:hypothetical protein [SAR324 cluster bacterium]
MCPLRSRIKFFLVLSIWTGLLCGFTVLHGSARAFDGQRDIADPDFAKDNFVDIKSYQPTQIRKQAWDSAQNGFRFVEGTLTQEIAYLATEVRFNYPITERLVVGYHAKGEAFYQSKPIRQLLDIQIKLWRAVSISLLGFQSYDKRSGDLGVGLTIGNVSSYLKLSHLEQDLYYNEKNLEDDSFQTAPVEDQLEGVYQFTEQLKGRFRLMLDRAFEQFYPDSNLTFTHQGQDGEFTLDYGKVEQQLAGMAYRGFDFEKARLTPNDGVSIENRKQSVQFHSTNFYWMRPVLEKYQITLGLQHDRFRNLLRDFSDSRDSFDYTFETWQLYAELLHPWNPNLNWEYGVYLGDASEVKNYLAFTKNDKDGRSLESKLRVSWEWHSVDQKAWLLLTSTWNIDNFADNVWDGGAFSTQVRFD